MFATPDEVNRFWLDEVGEKGWYNGTAKLDQTIGDRLMATWENAPALAPSSRGPPPGPLAPLISTSEFPRNMFRNDPRAFATDTLARHIADGAIAAGFDRQIDPPARQFFYMPFEHSEDLADQHRCIELFATHMPGENLEHAEMHRDTIACFGRFPWRNAALGRQPTQAETRVMEAGGYGALVSGKLSLADVTEMI